MPGVSHPLGETVSLDVSAILPEEEWTVVGIVPDVLHYGPSVPGVEGWSVPTQVVVAILLFVASVLASLGPGLRAARVDPVVSLSAD